MTNSYFTTQLDILAKEALKNLNWNTTQIYPSRVNTFKALEECPINTLKVVILGQDPYYTEGLATGLAFDVPSNLKNYPPSLNNIIECINKEGIQTATLDPIKGQIYDSILGSLPSQGVLLLNTALSVEQNKPNVHKKLWESFTKELISHISDSTENIIFLLWGANAISYIPYINQKKHTIFGSSHPSPLSYKKSCGKFPPFTEANHFAKVNKLLTKQKKGEILWSLL